MEILKKVNNYIMEANIFWFTGMSGVGKTTIAEGVKVSLESDGFQVLIIDGDNVRSELHNNLGFSKLDIVENNRLISELCIKNQTKYDVILVSIISPFEKSRNNARESIGNNFFEIYFYAGLDTLQKRDTKGLYKKARNNQIDNLIGVSAKIKYEPPSSPDLTINTENAREVDSINLFYNFIVTSYVNKK